MLIPHKLTPFSKSFLYPTLTASWRQARMHLQLSGQPAAPPQHINSHLATLTHAVWGTSSAHTAHLLATQPITSPTPGKAARGLKLGNQLLSHVATMHQSTQNWHTSVASAEWSQAQLLQVMEEVEPRTTEVWTWLHITAVLAVGSYAHLGTLISRFEKNAARAHHLRLGLTAGLSTPAASLLAALTANTDPRQLIQQFGHLPLQNNYEIAQPRSAEGWDTHTSRPISQPQGAWNRERAQTRRQDATKEALSRTSFLGRSALKKTIALVQKSLVAHAQAQDALTYAMSATRHWSHAAAAEGMSDGRLLQPDEIYLLEIEEIKQLMTGEWTSRERVAPLIAQRQNNSTTTITAEPAGVQALGVAGSTATGILHQIATPGAPWPDTPFIAHGTSQGPTWWQALLRAQGILDTRGNLLSWNAAAARAGDLAALFNVSASQIPAANSTITLQPHQNRIKSEN